MLFASAPPGTCALGMHPTQPPSSLQHAYPPFPTVSHGRRRCPPNPLTAPLPYPCLNLCRHKRTLPPPVAPGECPQQCYSTAIVTDGPDSDGCSFHSDCTAGTYCDLNRECFQCEYCVNANNDAIDGHCPDTCAAYTTTFTTTTDPDTELGTDDVDDSSGSGDDVGVNGELGGGDNSGSGDELDGATGVGSGSGADGDDVGDDVGVSADVAYTGTPPPPTGLRAFSPALSDHSLNQPTTVEPGILRPILELWLAGLLTPCPQVRTCSTRGATAEILTSSIRRRSAMPRPLCSVCTTWSATSRRRASGRCLRAATTSRRTGSLARSTSSGSTAVASGTPPPLSVSRSAVAAMDPTLWTTSTARAISIPPSRRPRPRPNRRPQLRPQPRLRLRPRPRP